MNISFFFYRGNQGRIWEIKVSRYLTPHPSCWDIEHVFQNPHLLLSASMLVMQRWHFPESNHTRLLCVWLLPCPHCNLWVCVQCRWKTPLTACVVNVLGDLAVWLGHRNETYCAQGFLHGQGSPFWGPSSQTPPRDSVHSPSTSIHSQLTCFTPSVSLSHPCLCLLVSLPFVVYRFLFWSEGALLPNNSSNFSTSF